MKHEGFWRKTEAENSKLPWPISSPSWPGREAFLARLTLVQKSATGVDYMGYSACRLCGKQNGASQYTLGNWTWPEGFEHYVREHDVRPSAHFERFVLDF